jgi:hypothetical protein
MPAVRRDIACTQAWSPPIVLRRCLSEDREPRTDQEQTASAREMVAFLRGMTFVGQLWPVYAWDDSPRIMALIVPRNVALAEVQQRFGPTITEADLKRALSACDVYDYEACDRPPQSRTSPCNAKIAELGRGTPPPTGGKMPIDLLKFFPLISGHFGLGASKVPSPRFCPFIPSPPNE